MTLGSSYTTLSDIDINDRKTTRDEITGGDSIN